jgi:carbamoyltransferase
VSKYVLGISAYYHDSGATLICDGEILGAVHEERFSRIKGDSNFPEKSIEYLLKLANISPNQLSEVAYYENPYLKFDRQLSTFLYGNFASIINFIYTVKINIKKKLWVEREIKKFLKNKSIVLTDHHLSHAASAFYPSPFEKAAIMTIDGVGEWSTTTIGYGEGANITLDKHIEYPNSLGLLYSAFTVFAGFKVNSGEYKLMGLAPFGEPKYYDINKNN